MSDGDKVRVVLFQPGQPAKLTEIDSSLAAMQKLVDGSIGVARITGRVYLHHDDDGRLRKKAPCVFVESLGDVVVGTCFAVGVERGEQRSLTDDEVADVLKLVRPVAFASRDKF